MEKGLAKAPHNKASFWPEDSKRNERIKRKGSGKGRKTLITRNTMPVTVRGEKNPPSGCGAARKRENLSEKRVGKEISGESGEARCVISAAIITGRKGPRRVENFTQFLGVLDRLRQGYKVCKRG